MFMCVLNHYYSDSQKLFAGKFNIQRTDFQKQSKQTTKTEINIHFPRNELVVVFARQPTAKVRTGSTISDVYKWLVQMFIFFFLLLPPFLFNIIKICKHIRFSILLLFYFLPQSSIVISFAILSWFAFWFFHYHGFSHSLAMRRINAHCFFSWSDFFFFVRKGSTFYIWKWFGTFFFPFGFH